MTRFYWLTGDVNWDVYGGTWISNKQEDGSYLVRELIIQDGCADMNEKYWVKLSEVNPSDASDDKIQSAISCCGIEEEWEALSEHRKVEALYACWGGDEIWSGKGNNYKKLFDESRAYC